MTAFDTAWAIIKAERPSYQGHHEAPLDAEYYPPIFNLLGMFPSDVYTNPEYYESSYLDEIMPIIMEARNNPFMEIPVYRAVPKGVQSEINPGDWVSPTRSYAEMHGERFDGGYDLLEELVNAHDLLNEGNSLHEYGWLGHRDGYKPDINKWIRGLISEEVEKAINGKSIAYYMTFDKIAEVEKAMGWKPMIWHTILTNDDELLRYLEEASQTDKYGPQYKAMMGAVLHSYMNDFDKGSMVEGME